MVQSIDASACIDTQQIERRASRLPELFVEVGEENYSPESVGRFLGWLKLRMDMLWEEVVDARIEGRIPFWAGERDKILGVERRSPVLDQVMIEKDRGGEGGMIWGVGLTEACKFAEQGSVKFPVAPVVWGIRITSAEGIKKWEEMIRRGEASAGMRKEIYERVFASHLPGAPVRERKKAKLLVDIHGWGGTPIARMHHAQEKYKGIAEAGCDPEDYVTMLISPMGTMGTGRLAIHGETPPTLEDAVKQCRGAVEGAARMLWEEWGTLGTNFDEERTWAGVGVVEGHSMGAWIAAGLLREIEPILTRLDVNDVKWLLDNPVIYGAYPDKMVKGMARELLGMEQLDPNHVLLLRKAVTGLMVRISPELMGVPWIKSPLAEKLVVPPLVRYYLGESGLDNGNWVWLNHNWTATLDPDFINLANMMLAKTPLIVQDEAHLELMRRLEGEGRLIVSVGRGDNILTAEPQFQFVRMLRARGYVETDDHYEKLSVARDKGGWLVTQARGIKESVEQMESRWPPGLVTELSLRG